MPPDLAGRVVLHDGQATFVLATKPRPPTAGRSCLPSATSASCNWPPAPFARASSFFCGGPGSNPNDLDRVLIGGGFGNFIRRSNAQRIGLLPSRDRAPSRSVTWATRRWPAPGWRPYRGEPARGRAACPPNRARRSLARRRVSSRVRRGDDLSGGVGASGFSTIADAGRAGGAAIGSFRAFLLRNCRFLPIIPFPLLAFDGFEPISPHRDQFVLGSTVNPLAEHVTRGWPCQTTGWTFARWTAPYLPARLAGVVSSHCAGISRIVFAGRREEQGGESRARLLSDSDLSANASMSTGTALRPTLRIFPSGVVGANRTNAPISHTLATYVETFVSVRCGDPLRHLFLLLGWDFNY